MCVENQKATMNFDRMERNMSVRVYLCKTSQRTSAVDDKKFASDVMCLLDDAGLDLTDVEARRRSALTAAEILRLRAERAYFPRRLWNVVVLRDMQFSFRPIACREFCLTALAMAWDSGVDLREGHKLAIMLALHNRVGAESPLALLGADLVAKILVMAIGE